MKLRIIGAVTFVALIGFIMWSNGSLAAADPAPLINGLIKHALCDYQTPTQCANVSNTGAVSVSVANPAPTSAHGYMAVEPGANSNGFPTPAPPATFSCTASALTLATANTDIFVIQASSTKTVRLRKLYISGTAGTAATVDYNLVLRSTFDTGGTSASITPVSLDSTNASPTATCLSYSAAPTAGSLVGDVLTWKQNFVLSTNGSTLDVTQLLNGQQFEQFPTLRSNTTYQLSIGAGANAVSSPSIDITAVFTEE